MTRLDSASERHDVEGVLLIDGFAGAIGAAAASRSGLWLQPQVTLSGDIAGHEATRRSSCGMFRADLSQSGDDIAWMLRQCCAEAAMSPGDAPGHIEIATAAPDLPSLAAKVRNTLRVASLPPSRLRLQIHVSALRLDESLSALRRLKTAGVQLVLGGFGAGALQPAILRCELFDGVKLDHAVFAGVKRGSRPHGVACGVVELGRRLAGDVLADGVETRAQLAMLRDAGCTLFQGALLGAPSPAQDLETIQTSPR